MKAKIEGKCDIEGFKIGKLAGIWILASTLIGMTFPIGTSAQSVQSAAAKKPDIVELIVLFSEDANRRGTTAREIVDAVKSTEKDVQKQNLFVRMNLPTDARYAIRERHNFDKAQIRNTEVRPGDEPPELLLQRYVVLSYPTPQAMAAALRTLEADPATMWVGPNIQIPLSATVSDPFAQYTGNVFTYQWGLYAINAFSAWDIVRGHAYVGHVDTGIQTGANGFGNQGTVDPNASFPNVHPDLQWNFRRQFAYHAYGGYFDDDIQGFRGHGTHTAGTIAATASNPYAQFGHPQLPSQGGAGVCWNCPLMVAKVYHSGGGSIDGIANAIYWATNSGAQAINLSLGGYFVDPQTGRDYTNQNFCATWWYDIWCQSLAFAVARDVVIVAAAGNSGIPNLQFPASDSRTIAAGGSDVTGARWVEQPVIYPSFAGSNYGPLLAQRGVLAPARDIVSTVYQGLDYSSAARCGDNVIGTPGDGYGPCTGTSMAAPHVTGIVGLMRSVNPLLGSYDIAQRLYSTSSNAWYPNQNVGYGNVNAYAAVANVQSTTNRLTPLFSFYSSGAMDYFYTTVPQMGASAVNGSLLPNNGGTVYAPTGTYLNSYAFFPGTWAQAQAQAWIFTTHVNPQNPSVELRPLYRLSYKCGDPLWYANPICNQNWLHVDHFYTTDFNEMNLYVSQAGYKLDGIEGYVYPYGYSQPPNTELLLRAYHASRDDHAIFPLSAYSTMYNQGYNSYVAYLGYVYRNYGNKPTY